MKYGTTILYMLCIVSCSSDPTIIQGPPGIDGTNGKDGGYCTVSRGEKSTTITCSDGSTATVLDGEQGNSGLNGRDGKNGSNGILSYIYPCGKESSPYKEVLLCLSNGTVLASFSDNSSGLNTRFTILSTGDYYDTDLSYCPFHVEVFSTGETELTWNSGFNQYGSWPTGYFSCDKVEE